MNPHFFFFLFHSFQDDYSRTFLFLFRRDKGLIIGKDRGITSEPQYLLLLNLKLSLNLLPRFQPTRILDDGNLFTFGRHNPPEPLHIRCVRVDRNVLWHVRRTRGSRVRSGQWMGGTGNWKHRLWHRNRFGVLHQDKGVTPTRSHVRRNLEQGSSPPLSRAGDSTTRSLTSGNRTWTILARTNGTNFGT